MNLLLKIRYSNVSKIASVSKYKRTFNYLINDEK